MPLDPTHPLPLILADVPLSPILMRMLAGRVEVLPWRAAGEPGAERIEAIYTYGHPTVDADLLDQLPGVRVISNFGVGVDHIDVAAAAARGIPVYWIADLPERRLEVYTDPTGSAAEPTYAQRRDYGPADTMPVVLDDVEVGTLPVEELLP